MVSAAKEQFEAKQANGAIAVISPSPHDLINHIVEDVHNSHHEQIGYCSVVDIGCGDCRWLLAWKRRFPKALVFGCEIEPEKLLVAQDLARTESTHLDLILCDYQELDISNMSIVIAYLSR